MKHRLQCRRYKLDPWVEKKPEKGVETHSRILAWEIPWTEEAGITDSMYVSLSELQELVIDREA